MDVSNNSAEVQQGHFTIDKIKRECDRFFGPVQYADEIYGLLVEDTDIQEPFAVLVNFIANADPKETEDPESRALIATLHGALLGVRIAREMLAEDYEDAFELRNVYVSIPSDDDNFEEKYHAMAVAYSSLGEKGYSAMDPDYKQLVEDLEMDLSSDYDYIPYVRRGIGAVMHFVNVAFDPLQALQTLKQAELSRQISALDVWVNPSQN